MEYKAGYKFKETHSDIHFVKTDHGSCTDHYEKLFTMDEGCAKVFETEEEAKSCILELMSEFKRDNDYRWTPVICRPDGSKEMILLSQWH